MFTEEEDYWNDKIYSINFIDERRGWISTGLPFDNRSDLRIYYTDDGGESWEHRSTIIDDAAQEPLYAVTPDTLWCGLRKGDLFRSSDGGYTWDRMNAPGRPFRCFSPWPEPYTANSGYAMTGESSITDLVSINFDKREYYIEAALPLDPIRLAATAGYSFWCTTFSNEIWRYKPSEPVAVIDKPKPTTLSTSNYPNPFNPSTTIEYTLPVAGNVTLTVYSVTGQKVATLVDGFMQARRHSAVFNGADLASGVYFYRLQSDDFAKTGKMLLVK